MIKITERAATEIHAARNSSDIAPAMELRVDVIGGARSGFAYDLFFDRIESTDRIVKDHGVTLLVRPDAVPYLEGAILDWVESDNGAGFHLSNPNEPVK